MAVALLFLIACSSAQTLRVTTWNLETPVPRQTNGAPANTNGIRIPAAAKVLKQLNPDVILLQQVPDWEICDQLAKALKPATYNVIVCSAFLDPRTGELRKQQVAILAKKKAYSSWTEPWHSKGVPPLPGGYAFAAFHIGKQQVGLYSVQAAPAAGGGKGKQQDPVRQQARSDAAAAQLLEHVGSVSNWVANRVEVFVVGGTFGAAGRADDTSLETPLVMLEEAGFGDALLELLPAERITLAGRPGGRGAVTDYLYAQPGGCTTSPRISHVRGFKHYPATCDVGLGPAAAIAGQLERSQGAQAAARKPDPAKPRKPAPQPAVAEPVSAPPSTPAAEHLPQPAAQLKLAPAPASVPPALAPVVAAAQPSARNPQLHWLVPALVGLVVAAGLIGFGAWRRRLLVPKPPALLTAGGEPPSSYTVVVGTRSATEATPAHAPPPPAPQPIIHVEAPGATHTHAEALRQRAQAAELRAERADAVIRRGLIPHLRQWLKHKLVRQLVTDRAQMLETQHAAARKAIAVEARLARIEQQVQQQNSAYQTRIEELTRELLTAKEENRELIRARIAHIKAEMETARSRLMAQSEAEDQRDA